MPPLKKLLSKFNKDDRRLLEFLIEKIVSLDWNSLNIKKLKGYQDIFRLRKERLRIIFSKSNNSIFIITIQKRSEKTYKL